MVMHIMGRTIEIKRIWAREYDNNYKRAYEIYGHNITTIIIENLNEIMDETQNILKHVWHLR